MPKPIRIESPVQLLVKGNDQRNFFEAFIEHLSLENIQVQDFGGVSELRGFLRALVDAPDFRSAVQSVGIVRDAETSATGRSKASDPRWRMLDFLCRTAPKSALAPVQR